MIRPPSPISSWRNRRASRAFGAAIVSGSGDTSSTWVGLEHEFLCHDLGGTRVDFRTVIGTLGLVPSNLVPSDPRAHWLQSGSVLTADKLEAEIATPPLELGPDFANQLDGWASWERASLACRVESLRFTGDSTHINVTLPGDLDPDAVADMFAGRFAVGQMLLMDRRTSPGLLVRPRPYRLEIGGEYAVGSALRAAAAYAAGATIACVNAVRWGATSALPPTLEVRLERNITRYGWYVARTAFGGDLYADGRSSVMKTAAGAVITAQQSMVAAWGAARQYLAPLVAQDDLMDADAMVAGAVALPIERVDEELEHAVAKPIEPRSVFGATLDPRTRPGYEVAPVMLTWELAIFLVADDVRSRAAFAAVPARVLATFVAALDAGELDEPILAYLRNGSSGRRLTKFRQTARPALYDELGLRAALLAPERDLWGNPLKLRALGRMPAQRAVGWAT